MDIKTGLATVSLLVLSTLPAFAQLRDWLAPLPATPLPGTADVLTFSDSTINYGSRAKVRIYRPEGVYDIDNSGLATPAATEAGADSKDQPGKR